MRTACSGGLYGWSIKTKFATLHPEQKFDLIFIDGNHAYEYCMLDILNVRALSRPNALIIIDDYDCPSVQQAIRECQEMRIIDVQVIHESHDPHGFRSWAEVCYLD